MWASSLPSASEQEEQRTVLPEGIPPHRLILGIHSSHNDAEQSSRKRSQHSCLSRCSSFSTAYISFWPFTSSHVSLWCILLPSTRQAYTEKSYLAKFEIQPLCKVSRVLQDKNKPHSNLCLQVCFIHTPHAHCFQSVLLKGHVYMNSVPFPHFMRFHKNNFHLQLLWFGFKCPGNF